MIQIDMTFFASILNFLLLTALLTFFLYRPVRKFMMDRQDRIKRSLEEAAQSRAESAKMKQEYEARLAQVSREAQDIIEKAVVQGERAQAEILDAARKEAKAILEQARAEAARERQVAFEALRDEIVDLVISTARVVTGKKVDSADDEAIVKRLLEEGWLSDAGEREL
ncbi:MAG: F0F1 ATP synthase subunit B [Firmicutes bacterium]|nr:F0F1 ATP synthase subunit B [Bacillota bacterium]HHY34007.1 F0F1 ATP synthase subunit B [Bacillota bacterium]